jgi:PKD repeat protein
VDKYLFRSLSSITLLLLLLALLLPGSSAADSGLAASYDGQVQVEGPVALAVLLSTAVTSPGETIMLQAQLSNSSPGQQSPAVRFSLPAALRLGSSAVPLGVSFNFQNNELVWRPLLEPGTTATISLPLRVETADISQPARTIQITLDYGEQNHQQSLPLWVGIAPQIQAVLRQPQATVGQPLVLQPELSGSGPLRQTWHLGDGRRVDVNNPTVVFPVAGVYELRLEVSNPLATVSGTTRITVVPHPMAHFELEDDTLSVGQMVPLLNLSGGKPPLQYRWDFGDGTVLQGPDPVHSYQSPGTYSMQLTVENQYGRSDAYALVTVGELPIADMEISSSTLSDEPVVGQAYGDDTVIQYQWDMGDGRHYEGERIVHQYRSSGNFYVVMTAWNEYGSTQVGRWVYVNQGTTYLFLPFIMQDESDESDVDPFALDLAPIPLDAPFELEVMAEAEMLPAAERLLFYINEARSRFDLEPLAYDPTLSTAAQHHAVDMARFAYTGHTGWDGSLPAERFLHFGYPRGYAGEATAWGFEHAYEAVEFWVNSDPHRPIILNQFASEVGVGYTADFNAPNVWYWTAEFGDGFGAPPQPLLRLDQPVIKTEALITAELSYSWNWPLPLAVDEEFVLYLYTGRDVVAVGRTGQPVMGTRYRLPLVAYDWVTQPGDYSWRVRLLQGTQTVAESEWRSLTLLADPDLPTPTPVTPTPTPTPTQPPLTAVPTVTPTSTLPTAPTLPPPPTMPPLVTATPQP